MSTNDRLLSQVESFMDDLVDCFEEFIKKSMLVVSVAVGTLVLMVMYVLKLMYERTPRRPITDTYTAVDTAYVNNSNQDSHQLLKQTTTDSQSPWKNLEPIKEFLPAANTKTISVQVFPNIYSSFGPSCDESFMNETDLGINSKLESCKQTQLSDDLKSARTESKLLNSRQSCITKNHSFPSRRCSKFNGRILERHSCCSLCCEDDTRSK